MTSNPSSSSKLKREAVAWHVRLGAPDATGEDWSAFTDWLEVNPEGGEFYDEVEKLSRELSTSQSTILTVGDDPDPSASVGIPDVSNVTVLKQRRTASPQVWSWLAAAAAIAIAFMMLPVLRDSLSAPSTDVWRAYSAPSGDRKTVVLADGSSVTLNSGATISVALTANERLVKMDGSEAFFDVTHDVDRPFIVQSADAEVRVLGTQFNVLSTEGRLEVGVKEGRVQVSFEDSEEAGFILPPGKELIRIDQGKAEVADIDVSTAFAWTQGSLIYDDAPLAEIIMDVNRNFERRIVLADDVDGTMTFSGVLALSSENDVLNALVAFLPLEAEIDEQQVTLHARR
jgi:transmembrane sensor